MKKTLVKEKVKKPCKERKMTPIKESNKTPTGERLMISTTKGKMMCITIFRGIKLGWSYFLRTQPDIYEDLDTWMMKTWAHHNPIQGEDSTLDA